LNADIDYFVSSQLKSRWGTMFDEDPFSVFNETGSSAEKSGNRGNVDTKTKHPEDKVTSEKPDNKR